MMPPGSQLIYHREHRDHEGRLRH